MSRALLDVKHAVTVVTPASIPTTQVSSDHQRPMTAEDENTTVSHTELIEQLEVVQSTLVRIMKASLRSHSDPDSVFTLGQVVRAISVVLAHPSEPDLVREALLAPARPLPAAHRAKVAAQHKALLELAIKSCADSRARLSALQCALSARTSAPCLYCDCDSHPQSHGRTRSCVR